MLVEIRAHSEMWSLLKHREQISKYWETLQYSWHACLLKEHFIFLSVTLEFAPQLFND